MYISLDSRVTDSLSHSRRLVATLLAALLAVATLGIGPAAVWAQEGGSADEEEEIPEPEDLTLVTRDGVILGATYYGSLEGDEAVPVVCLHGLEGSRNEFSELALDLQEQGYAVLTVDLRGHGGSTEVQGSRVKLDPSRLTPQQIQLMVAQDLEAVNRFLWKKNNDKELNLNKLCLIGAETGAVVAANYAARDWSIRNYGALQQGRFVKGLVLLSPPLRTKGLDMIHPMQHPALTEQIAALLLFGELDRSARNDAEKIYRRMLDGKSQPKEPRERRVFASGIDTRLQGTKLLDSRLRTARYISVFIKLKLAEANGPQFQWKELKRPHQ